MRTFLEFFAGGGMARAGLSSGWRPVFANDLDPAKAAAYRLNWGAADFVEGDVASLTPADIPAGRADLAWASFPCQDLSLAGARKGLQGGRSSVFWPFWRLMQGLGQAGRMPRLLVLENVVGLLTSNGGADFQALAAELHASGCQFTAAVIDAAHFTPQSRPRLFIVALTDPSASFPSASAPDPAWTPPALLRAVEALPADVRSAWRWPDLPAPPRRNLSLKDIVEAAPTGVAWATAAETQRILDLMSPVNHAKVKAAQATGDVQVGTVFRRTRPGPDGKRLQRAEVRFDGTAGCLRTPAGGSSRQMLMVVEGARIRTRLLGPREAARLMGLSDDYRLPARLNPALHLLGDGVAVPAVRFLAAHLLEPVLDRRARRFPAGTVTSP